VRPGIASVASLPYCHVEHLPAGPDWEKVYREQVLPAKLAVDLAYLEHRSLRQDVFLILRTIQAMAR